MVATQAPASAHGGASIRPHIEVGTGRHFWITGPKRKGGDRLYGSEPVEIDEDVREEYWIEIRGEPERTAERSVRGVGKHTG